jgi:hypothetical protein
MGKACSVIGREEECIENFGGKSRSKENATRLTRKREYNIKIDLREI